MFGPVLQGSCFRLRLPRREDAAASLTWLEDLEVTVRLREIYPPSLERAQEHLRSTASDPDSVVWTIEHEGRPVGFTGNEASRRGQAAAGYRETARYCDALFGDGFWMDSVQTELYREDWASRRKEEEAP